MPSRRPPRKLGGVEDEDLAVEEIEEASEEETTEEEVEESGEEEEISEEEDSESEESEESVEEESEESETDEDDEASEEETLENEEDERVEDEVPADSIVLDTNISGGRITATMGEDAGIPADADLHAELVTGTEEEISLDLATEAVLADLDIDADDCTIDAVVYDIYFTYDNEDGESVRQEPNDKVQISIDYAEAYNLGTADDAENVNTAIVHIKGSDDPDVWEQEDVSEQLSAEVLTKASNDVVTVTDDNNNIEQVRFCLGSFSNVVLMNITRAPKATGGITVSATTVWRTQEVDRYGKALAGKDPVTLDPEDTNGIKQLRILDSDLQKVMPNSITYQVQYRKAGSDGDWIDCEEQTATLTGNRPTSTDGTGGYQYAVSLSGLTEKRDIEENGVISSCDVEYRIIETGMKMPSGSSTVDASRETKDDQTVIGGMTISEETTNEDSAYVTTVTNTILMRELAMRLYWDDEEDVDNKRVAASYMILYRDANDDLTGTWYEIPSYAGYYSMYHAIDLHPEMNVLDDSFFGLYVDQVMKPGRSVGKYSIWERDLLVPYYQNGSSTKVSDYVVKYYWTRTHINNGYRVSWCYNIKYANKKNQVYIKASDEDFVSTYIYRRFADTSIIQPTKTWEYNGDGSTNKWSSTSSTNTETSVISTTTTMTTDGKAYLEKLSDNGYGYRLRYSVATTNNKGSNTGTMTRWQSEKATDGNTAWGHPDYSKSEWTPVDEAYTWKDGDKEQSYTPDWKQTAFHKATFTYDSESNGKVDVTTTIEPWKDLPINWFNAAVDANGNLTHDAIHYQVEEGFEVGSGDTAAFYSIDDLQQDNGDWSKDKANAAQIGKIRKLLNAWNWTTASDGSDISNQTKDSTKTLEYKSALKVTSIETTKQFSDKGHESKRPNSIEYQLQHKAGKGGWNVASNGWITDSTVTGGTYEAKDQLTTVKADDKENEDDKTTFPSVSITELPQYNPDGDLYDYRIRETKAGEGYKAVYTVDGKRQTNGTFASTITNTFITDDPKPYTPTPKKHDGSKAAPAQTITEEGIVEEIPQITPEDTSATLDESGTLEESGHVSATGDDSRMTIYGILAGTALATLAAWTITTRRRRQR